MKKYICKELNKEFETRAEMFAELELNKEFLIAEKKSKIYKSALDGKNTVTAKILDKNFFDKAITKNALTFDDKYFYIAVNSAWILDYHDDLHTDTMWNKSVQEQQGKNYLILDHNFNIANTVVRKEYIEMFTAEIPFTMLGYEYEGNTVALIYKFLKSKVLIKEAREWLESGDHIEASVRMQYVIIDLAYINETELNAKSTLLYNMYFPKIANKEDFEDPIEYFWIVSEGKNIKESSLVLEGSNKATGILNAKQKENISRKYINTAFNSLCEKLEPANATLKNKAENEATNFLKLLIKKI